MSGASISLHFSVAVCAGSGRTSTIDGKQYAFASIPKPVGFRVFHKLTFINTLFIYFLTLSSARFASNCILVTTFSYGDIFNRAVIRVRRRSVVYTV